MQKGSGSGKGGAGANNTGGGATPTAEPGRAGQAAILSEPTQRLDAARIAQAAEPAAEADPSVLDVDEAWEDLASEDNDGEVESLSEDDVDLAEPSVIQDIEDVLDQEAESEGRVDDGLEDGLEDGLGDEPSQPQASYELSGRVDVSDEVLEELSFPKHLAANAAKLRPLNEPLFDNMPTQQAPEELRAALLGRGLVQTAAGAVTTLRGDQVAKLRGDQAAKLQAAQEGKLAAARSSDDAVSRAASQVPAMAAATSAQLPGIKPAAEAKANTSVSQALLASSEAAPAGTPQPDGSAKLAVSPARTAESIDARKAKAAAPDVTKAAAPDVTKAADPKKQPAATGKDAVKDVQPTAAGAKAPSKAPAGDVVKAAAKGTPAEHSVKMGAGRAGAGVEPVPSPAVLAPVAGTGKVVAASLTPAAATIIAVAPSVGKAVPTAKPAAVEAAKPAAVEAAKPAAVEAAKPAAVEVAKPAAVEVAKPAQGAWNPRLDQEKIKPIPARLGVSDATMVELGPAPVVVGASGKRSAAETQPVVSQALGPATPTLIAAAPVLPSPAKRSAAETQPVISQAVGPATPTLIAAAPILLPTKPTASGQPAAGAGKSLGPISIAVPASLLKKEPASSKPTAERVAGEARPAGAGLSGATFVLPTPKESPSTPTAARIVTRERPPRAADFDESPRGTGRGGGGGSGAAGPAGGNEPPGDEVRRGIELRVQKRAREFSLPALLDVLQLLDYRPDEIEFLGVMSYAFPGSLIHSVNFLSAPRRMVRISLHMGLLSAQSPLPSYFLKYAENLEIDALFDFLGFFDHHLLKRRAASLYPERDRTLFADWSETQAQLLQLVGLTAPSTLHWLFQRVYPELGIEVRRSTERKPLNAEGVVLGNAKLGEACAFGGGTTVPVGGLEVTLYSEEELTPTGTAWAVEASQRLNRQVFSALGETDVYLTVYLVIMEQTSWLMMEDERYLGFEPLWENLRGDLEVPGATSKGSKDKKSGGRQAELLARSRSAYRIHQVQLFSGPIKIGKTGTSGQDNSSMQLLAGMARS